MAPLDCVRTMYAQAWLHFEAIMFAAHVYRNAGECSQLGPKDMRGKFALGLPTRCTHEAKTSHKHTAMQQNTIHLNN